MSSAPLADIVLDIQELDVEEGFVIACARRLRVVLLLDVLLWCGGSCSSFFVKELPKLLSNFCHTSSLRSLVCTKPSSESWVCCAATRLVAWMSWTKR